METSSSISPQMGGKRKLSKWNKFTSKVYATEHRKNKNFKFKDALKMASAMKKKGQYGGEGEEDGTFSTVPLTTTPQEDGSLATSQIGREMADAPYGGRRRRRTMRRSRGRGRSRGRSRGRGRARASRRR